VSPGTIVFLTPAAGVWSHALPELPLMEAMVRQGYSVIALTCSDILSRQCTVMHSKGVNAKTPALTRRAVCADCKSCDSARRQVKGVEWVDLSSLLLQDEVKMIRRAVDDLHIDEIEGLNVNGVALGMIAAYETLLHSKARPHEALNSNWESYLGDLQASWLTLAAVDALTKSRSVDCLVVYNGLYAANRSAWELAIGRGVRVVDIHAVSHPTQGYEYIRVEEELWPRFGGRQEELWLRTRMIPLRQAEVQFAEEYLLGGIRSKAAWSYSPERSKQTREEVLTRLSLVSDRPVISVLLNSLDERVAATFVGVNTDASWPLEGDTPIDRFIENASAIALRRPEWQFLIRVHPRMVAGQRDGVTSPELTRLQSRLAAVPSNVVIDWPEMGISLFDVALISDAALSIGTTAGLQFMSLGIPTVLCDRDQEWTFASDLYFPSNGEETADIEDALDKALVIGATLETARAAYRFIVFQHLRSSYRVRPDASMAQSHEAETSKTAKESPRRSSAWQRQIRRWASKEPTGFLAGALLSVKRRARERTREVEVAEILAPDLSLDDLTDAVLGHGGDRRLGGGFTVEDPGGTRQAQEDAYLRRSLEQIYVVLGVPTPDWIRHV
jgi:hypothetical protein